MDPFVSTIIKQAILVGLGIGALAFLFVLGVKMANLQHAMTLNMLPTPLP